MKNIGISDEVYELLLGVKHFYEKEEGVVLSYDKIIRKLIKGDRKDGNGKGDKPSSTG